MKKTQNYKGFLNKINSNINSNLTLEKLLNIDYQKLNYINSQLKIKNKNNIFDSNILKDTNYSKGTNKIKPLENNSLFTIKSKVKNDFLSCTKNNLSENKFIDKNLTSFNDYNIKTNDLSMKKEAEITNLSNYNKNTFILNGNEINKSIKFSINDNNQKELENKSVLSRKSILKNSNYKLNKKKLISLNNIQNQLGHYLKKRIKKNVTIKSEIEINYVKNLNIDSDKNISKPKRKKNLLFFCCT